MPKMRSSTSLPEAGVGGPSVAWRFTLSLCRLHLRTAHLPNFQPAQGFSYAWQLSALHEGGCYRLEGKSCEEKW